MARNLMRHGDLWMKSRDYAQALEAYRGAHEIMAVSATGIAMVRALLAMNRGPCDPPFTIDKAGIRVPKPQCF
jgi:hypothetical protein